jgi:hypothetical protein|tara:strand:- start:418 stop:531 length:114 start_codon:yes stop_codon:yes gene_type:complete
MFGDVDESDGENERGGGRVGEVVEQREDLRRDRHSSK